MESSWYSTPHDKIPANHKSAPERLLAWRNLCQIPA